MSARNPVRRVEALGVLAAALHAAAFAALFARAEMFALHAGIAALAAIVVWSWARKGIGPRPWLPFVLLFLYAAAEAAGRPPHEPGWDVPGLAFLALVVAAFLAHARWSEACFPAAATRGRRPPPDETEDRTTWSFDELLALLALSATAVLAGAFLLAAAPFAASRRTFGGLSPPAADLLAAGAVAGIAALLARGTLAAWRRIDLSTEQAELLLYDTVWREHAGELARQSRLFARAGRRQRQATSIRPPAAFPGKSRPLP